MFFISYVILYVKCYMLHFERYMLYVYWPPYSSTGGSKSEERSLSKSILCILYLIHYMYCIFFNSKYAYLIHLSTWINNKISTLKNWLFHRYYRWNIFKVARVVEGHCIRFQWQNITRCSSTTGTVIFICLNVCKHLTSSTIYVRLLQLSCTHILHSILLTSDFFHIFFSF